MYKKVTRCTHLQTSQRSIVHHTEEFLMAQTVVSIYIKEFKHCVQHILRQIVACGDPHSSPKLGCKQNKESVVICCKQCEEEFIVTKEEVLPIPTGRLASVTIFTEKAKSSRLLVKRQKARNSSNVILCHTKYVRLHFMQQIYNMDHFFLSEPDPSTKC